MTLREFMERQTHSLSTPDRGKMLERAYYCQDRAQKALTDGDIGEAMFWFSRSHTLGYMSVSGK